MGRAETSTRPLDGYSKFSSSVNWPGPVPFAVHVSLTNFFQPPLAKSVVPVPEAVMPVTFPSVMISDNSPVGELKTANEPGLRTTPWFESKTCFAPSCSQIAWPVAMAPAHGPLSIRQEYVLTEIEWLSRSPMDSFVLSGPTS